MSKCPSRDELRLYLSPSDFAPNESEIEAHVDSCERCALFVAQLVDDEPLIKRLRDADHARNDARVAMRDLTRRISTTIDGMR